MLSCMKIDPNWHNLFRLMYVIIVLECLYSVMKFFVGIESHSVCTQGCLVTRQGVSSNWARCLVTGHDCWDLKLNKMLIFIAFVRYV